MPDRTYTVVYDLSTAVKAAQDVGTLTQALMDLEVVADRVKPKLQGFAAGVSTGFTNTAKASDKLKTSLEQVAISGNKASASFQGLQNQAVAAGAKIQVFTGHSRSAGNSLTDWMNKGLHLNATLARVSYAAAGIVSAVTVWKAFEQSLHNADEFAKETADHVLKLNDEIREMKVITGQTAREARADVLKLMTESGMSEQEATSFNTTWGSAITAAQKSGNWKLTAAETEKARTEAATFARQNKIDPAAVGKMVPLMGTVQPLTSADQVLGELGGVHKMGVEAAGTFTQMAKQLLKTEGGMVRPEGGGAFRSVAELSAGVSAMSAFAPMERIPTELRAIWAEGASPKSKQEREKLGGIGITPGKSSMPEMVERYGDYLEGTRKRGLGDEDALRALGITSRTATRGIIDAVKARKMWSANLAEVHKASDPAAMRQAMRATDIESPHAQAEAALQAAKDRAGEQTIAVEGLRPFAMAEMIEKEGYTSKPGFWEALGGHFAEASGMEDPRTARQNEIIRQQVGRINPAMEQQYKAGVFRQGNQMPGPGPINSRDLASMVRAMSPAEQAKLFDAMRGLTVPMAGAPAGAAGAGTVLRPPGAAAAAPPAAGGGAGPQASLDAEQLRVLQSIDRKLDGGGGSYGIGPLPIDGGDIGPRRA